MDLYHHHLSTSVQEQRKSRARPRPNHLLKLYRHSPLATTTPRPPARTAEPTTLRSKMVGVVALPLISISPPPLPRIRDARSVLRTHPFPPSPLLRLHSPILHRMGRATLLLPKASGFVVVFPLLGFIFFIKDQFLLSWV